jgi:hypothetical protein
MSWFDLRSRSPDPNAAILRALIQSKIDDEIQAHEPEDPERFEQGIESYSSINLTDDLSWSFLREVSIASSDRNYIPFEPDLDKLRLWVKNEHGGTILKDHAKMENIIKIHGHKPPAIAFIGDQDGLTGNRLCNIFDGNQQFDPDIVPGGQFLRILDNPNVRIKELLTSDSLTIFCRIYPITAQELDYMVLFSKLDDEQATCGYISYIDRGGYIYFIVRKDNKERVIKTPTAIWATVIDKADFDPVYFQEQYFKTKPTGVYVLPKPIPFIDLTMTCKFSDMSMSIIQDGITVADTSPIYDSLVAHFRLNEGGNIGTTLQEQTPSLARAYNSATVSGANNGTIAGATWTVPDPLFPNASRLLFPGGTNKSVLITNYTAIQNHTELTIFLQYWPNGIPGQGLFHNLVAKNWNNNGAFIIYVDNPSGTPRLVFSVKNDAGTAISVVVSNPFSPGFAKWYNIIVAWKAGEAPTLTINNTKTTGGSTQSGTVSTGSTSLIIGATSASSPDGVIFDVQFFNLRLSDAQRTSLYNTGYTITGFPSWKADAPLPLESPDPITNPFQKYYDVGWITDPAQRAETKLHAKIISGFTTFYDTNDDSDVPGSEQEYPYSAFYDVQPAGGGGSPGTPYDVSVSGASQHLEFEGGVSRAGVRFNSGNADLGKAVTSVTVRYRRQGSPSGSASVGIRKNSDGSFVSLGTFSVSSGSGELSATINASSNSYAMQANDIVSVEYSSGSNTIELSYGSSGVSGFTSLEYDGSWSTFNDNGSTVIAMSISVGSSGSGGYEILKPIPRPTWSDKVYTRVGAAISSSSFSGIGKKITKVVVSMTRVGSPGGTIRCKIFKGGSTSNTVQIGPNKSAGDIPTSQGNVTFEFATEAERLAQTYALVSGDIIGIDVSGGSSSSSNYYIVHHNATSSISYIWSKYYNTVSPSSGWQYDNSAYEVIGQFYEGGFDETIPTVYAHIKLDHLTIRAAEHFATSSAGIGKTITKITPRFKKYGNPTGSISVVIRNSSGTQMTSFGVIDAVVDITSDDAWQAKDFTNISNTRQCAAGDRVSVEYGAGDANNYVMVSMNLNTDNYDASLSYAQTWPAGGSAYANAGGVTTYDIAGYMSEGGIQTDPDGRTRVGQRCNSPTSVMRGKKVTRAIVYLHKINSPPSSTFVLLRVRKADTDAIAYTIGQIDASTLAASATAYTIENVNNVYVMQQNDILSVEYESGDDSNYVILTRSKNDIYETTGNLSQIVDYNAPSYNALTSDLIGELWTGGDTYTPAVDEQIIRDPFYHHDLLIGAGGWDWSYYAAVGTITNHVGLHIMPEFRIYWDELTTAQALNLFTNRCTISDLALSQIAKVGTFGVALNPEE